MVIFTFVLAIVVFYWILAFIGAVDTEMFDVDFDLDPEINTDIDAEGLSGVTGFMLKWGLTGIPVTVVISILMVMAWLICYSVVSIVFPFLYPILPWKGLQLVLGLVLIIVSLGLAIPVTAWMIKPFKSIFISHTAVNKSSLIGKDCVVKTGKVNSHFGQAELEDGGAGMILDVRADEAYGIKKGDVVILTEYDEEEGSYLVTKAD